MAFKVLTIIALVYLANSAWGYSTIPGDKRVVKGSLNAQFDYMTTLPGNYTRLVSGIQNYTFANGNCSSLFFLCYYVLDDDSQMTVEIVGFMSWGLKWITFFGDDDLIPISILFFTDNLWNNLASGSIQPQYDVPLITRAKGLTTVSVGCTIFSTSPKYELYLDSNKTLYYSNVNTVTNSTQEYPQILNFQTRDIILHKHIEITVQQKNPIDFYSCYSGGNWLTHTIDWTQSKADPFKASVAVVLASLFYAGF